MKNLFFQILKKILNPFKKIYFWYWKFLQFVLRYNAVHVLDFNLHENICKNLPSDIFNELSIAYKWTQRFIPYRWIFQYITAAVSGYGCAFSPETLIPELAGLVGSVRCDLHGSLGPSVTSIGLVLCSFYYSAAMHVIYMS